MAKKAKTWREKRRELRQEQREREANAVRRVVIKLDDGSQTDGVVENVIKADAEFTLPGRLIVDWTQDCRIGGRYEQGVFVPPSAPA